MKTLITLLLIAFTSLVSAQTTCTVCTKPTITGSNVTGSTLTVGWDNQWFWNNGCSKGVSILVDGVEYMPNGNMVYGTAVSDAIVSGYVAVPNTPICVVVRNYCTDPWTVNPTYFVDSDPTCLTVPATATVTPCKQGNKYVLTNGSQTVLVNKIRCQRLITQGWVSSCDCQ